MSRINVADVSVTGWSRQSQVSLVPVPFVAAGGAAYVFLDSPLSPFSWCFGVALAVVALSSVLVLARTWTSLRLSGDRLRVVEAVRARWIPLADVAGVGLLMLYAGGRGGVPAGWFLTIVDAAGRRSVVAECGQPDGWTSHDYYNGGAAAKLSADELGSSLAGIMARRIFEIASQAQGSGGLLADGRGIDAADWRDLPQAWACWSLPEGRVDFRNPGGYVGLLARGR